MRLRKIKLAGFKSFVDPTTIEFPGDLVGIVGPNGCGKSNIIDAVRWVIGETSAKHLRGESMADVVFSGSSARKPLSQASVELSFDNSDGTLGGRFAGYAEISIKRQIARDAQQSSYFLNGTRCRRRDVTDVFLGTGLGPRSYAIIEQGMISRIIEAKPDELREFLEEAAGISKYKERRRETESRISRTQENLDRLADIREELEQRLEHLKRQAELAEKYKVLKREQRALRAQLLGLRWRHLDAEARAEEAKVAEQEIALEAALAEQRSLESALEKQRADHAGATDAYNGVYRQVLDAGAEVARMEESIQHLRARQGELEAELAREGAALEDVHEQAGEEQREAASLNEALAAEQPELERLQGAETGSREEFARAEREVQSLQATLDALNERAARPSEVAQTERARIAHLEEHLGRLAERAERLEREFSALSSGGLEQQLEGLNAEVERESSRLHEAEASLTAEQRAIGELRDAVARDADALHATRERQQEARGRLVSLQALQEEALGKRPGTVSAWLGSRGLASADRLAERLEVQRGWERAVETVLGLHLEAVCVAELEASGRDIASLSEGRVELLESAVVPREPADPRAARLIDKIESRYAVADLLDGVLVAEDIGAALAMRARLEAGESVVTRDGIWLGRHWMRYAPTLADGAGVLSREQEIQELAAAVDEAKRDLERLDGEWQEARRRLREREASAQEGQRSLGERHRRFTERKSELSAKRTALDQARHRSAAIRAELAEVEGQAQRAREERTQAERRAQSAVAELERMVRERETLAERRRDHRARLDAARERWQAVRDDVYEVGIRAESMRTKLSSLRTTSARTREQIQRVERRRAELSSLREATHEPLREARQGLDRKLVARRELEQALDAARRRVEELESSLHASEQQRGAAEKRVQGERTSLEEIRLRARDAVVRRATVLEQLSESGSTLEAALEALPEEASVAEWEERIERLDRRIARLGPINLAAIDEREQQAQRKTYLDAQHGDLAEALETLRAAIRKIDLETRARFKETYEKVNAGLAEAFPRLFGGGTAFLQMTGDDLLSTGISVVARPPGKRNTSIQLLSGGEKALAAIALVFSIFELNPAPFCLLDEVDAPLDDANVGRFCDLVRSMTERVQIVIVTHNKTTMEMTEQLIGVTMNEPGISRLVTVDVDEAVRLAAV